MIGNLYNFKLDGRFMGILVLISSSSGRLATLCHDWSKPDPTPLVLLIFIQNRTEDLKRKGRQITIYPEYTKAFPKL